MTAPPRNGTSMCAIAVRMGDNVQTLRRPKKCAQVAMGRARSIDIGERDGECTVVTAMDGRATESGTVFK